MAAITMTAILAKLGETLDAAKAEELLALALEKVSLPVQESYTPAQVASLGAAIADAQRSALAGSDVPEARELESTIGPLIDAIKQDAPHLK